MDTDPRISRPSTQDNTESSVVAMAAAAAAAKQGTSAEQEFDAALGRAIDQFMTLPPGAYMDGPSLKRPSPVVPKSSIVVPPQQWAPSTNVANMAMTSSSAMPSTMSEIIMPKTVITAPIVTTKVAIPPWVFMLGTGGALLLGIAVTLWYVQSGGVIRHPSPARTQQVVVESIPAPKVEQISAEAAAAVPQAPVAPPVTPEVRVKPVKQPHPIVRRKATHIKNVATVRPSVSATESTPPQTPAAPSAAAAPTEKASQAPLEPTTNPDEWADPYQEQDRNGEEDNL